MASLGRNGLIQVYENIYSKCQCTESRRITFMVRQTFVWWVLYILYKFVKFPIRHLSLAIGNVRRFSPTLQCRFNWVNRPLEDTLWYKFIFILLYHAMISITVYISFFESYFFSTVIFGDIDNIMNIRVFIYQTSSFLFSHRYLFLTETFGNIWCMHLEERLSFGIPDHWWLIYLFIYF